MANQMERIATGLRAEAHADIANEILGECGAMPLGAEQKEQGRWIKTLIEKMDNALSEDVRARVMESCGRQCIPSHVISEASKAYAQSKDMDDFLAKLNEMQINGGALKREGDTIQVRYRVCYCGVVNQVGERISKTYCNCSIGWNKAFFESVLQKPVNVKLVESVISGAGGCLLEVSF